MVKVYQPQIRLWLWKTRLISPVATGGKPIDLTGYLGDNSTVTVTRSVRDACGTFIIRFADQPNRTYKQSIYKLVEPMDMVIIRMTHDPVAPGSSPDDPLNQYGGGTHIPLIMRGMVTNVQRNETMTDNGPQRWVTITGQDQMKILQVYRINYLWGTDTGIWTEMDFRFAHVFAPVLYRKNKNANEFLDAVLTDMINPFIAKMADLNKVDDNNMPVLQPWMGDFSLPAADNVCPDPLSRFDDVTLYDALKSVLDVGLFNELYIEEDDENTYLVARPMPFKDLYGNFIQGTALNLDIPSKDVVSIEVTRSDAESCNYFWITSLYDKKYNLDQRAAAYAGGGSLDWITKNYINSDERIMSVRKMEMPIEMTPFVVTDGDALPAPDVISQGIDFIKWLRDKRIAMANMNKNEMVFEKGTLRLRGNHNIKAGMYLSIMRGPLQIFNGEVYAHTITHEYDVMNGFFTIVRFDRGTSFINMCWGNEVTYIDELEEGAVYGEASAPSAGGNWQSELQSSVKIVK